MEVRDFPLALLPRVTHRELQLGRRLRRHLGADAPEALQRWAREWLGLTAGGELSLRVGHVHAGPLDGALHQRLQRASRWILHGTDAQQALVALDRPLGREVAALLLRARRAPAVHDGVVEGIVSFALDGLLGELQPRSWMLCEPPAPLPAASTELIVVETRVTLRRRRFVAWLLIDDEAVAALDESAPAWRARWLDGLDWPATLELTRVPIDSAQLGSLQVGDAVVWPDCPKSVPRSLRLVVGRGSFGVELSDDRITITEPFRPKTGASKMSAEGDTTVVGELEVEVAVELGRVRMSAAELMQLGTGDALTVGRPVGGKLDLRVGGRLIASGELVDVEGEAGVRITDLYD